MVGRFAVLMVLSAIAGCSSVERRPEAISLKAAESLELEGKPAEAALAYALLLDSLHNREDFEAGLARSRIFGRLVHLRVWEIPGLRARFPRLSPYLGKESGSTLLAASARESVLVITEVSSNAARVECSSRIAGVFLEKAENLTLRVRSLGNPLLEKILLLEVAGIYEALHLSLRPSMSRDRLMHISRLISSAYLDMADLPSARPFSVDQWREIAGKFRNRIEDLQKGSPLVDSERWEKRMLHLNLQQHLQEGTYWADRATVERTSNGDQKQCERAYRNALRHLVFIGELLPRGESEFENALSLMPVVLRGWKTVCFQEP